MDAQEENLDDLAIESSPIKGEDANETDSEEEENEDYDFALFRKRSIMGNE